MDLRMGDRGKVWRIEKQRVMQAIAFVARHMCLFGRCTFWQFVLRGCGITCIQPFYSGCKEVRFLQKQEMISESDATSGMIRQRDDKRRGRSPVQTGAVFQEGQQCTVRYW